MSTPDARVEQRAIRTRSLALLREMIRPSRGPPPAPSVLVVLAQLALVAGPALVAYGIDTALPALRDGPVGAARARRGRVPGGRARGRAGSAPRPCEPRPA